MLLQSIKDSPTTLLSGPLGTMTVEELRTHFDKQRYHDDEFARQYRRGEFVDWLNDEGYILN